jgi:hypothetical protein
MFVQSRKLRVKRPACKIFIVAASHLIERADEAHPSLYDAYALNVTNWKSIVRFDIEPISFPAAL